MMGWKKPDTTKNIEIRIGLEVKKCFDCVTNVFLVIISIE